MSALRSFCALALLIALPLTGCGKGDEDDLNALDEQLTQNAVDPALKSALEGKIVVDPKLADQSNRNAVRPADRPADAALPVLKGDAAKALAQAVKQAGGKLLATPAPTEGEAMESTATLGALAREQSGRGGNVTCRKQLAYGMQWASRMPEPFVMFPGAELKEAAGADKDGCTLRAASFVTPVPQQSVMDFYYTQARRSGFDAEHKILGGDHVLGGTRKDDGTAFLLLFTGAPGGRTNVDIIADNGR